MNLMNDHPSMKLVMILNNRTESYGSSEFRKCMHLYPKVLSGLVIIVKMDVICFENLTPFSTFFEVSF